MLSSDLPGVNPTTLNGMILYYHLMTQWIGLGDSTKLSRVGLLNILLYMYTITIVRVLYSLFVFTLNE
jgi:hypothetical protein